MQPQQTEQKNLLSLTAKYGMTLSSLTLATVATTSECENGSQITSFEAFFFFPLWAKQDILLTQ